MVKPGGSLAYTTCTFSAEENETVIARFLSVHPEFDLATIQPAMGIQSARPEWIDLPSMHKLNRAVRIWPHISQGEGHFIALLIKQGLSKSTMSVDVRNHPTKRNSSAKSTFPKTAWTILDDFCRANLDLSFDISRLILDGSYVFQLPEIAPDLAGLKVIRPGWWLGTTTKGRLIPSHSLALGITKGNSQRSLSLQNDDPQISAYLRGESLPSSGDDGWVLVTVDGFPIGWGKRVQNVVKNFYPHGLRHFK
jgi:NOL1/NOP2/fmu family ribosome biogenesis protein